MRDRNRMKCCIFYFNINMKTLQRCNSTMLHVWTWSTPLKRHEHAFPCHNPTKQIKHKLCVVISTIDLVRQGNFKSAMKNLNKLSPMHEGALLHQSQPAMQNMILDLGSWPLLRSAWLLAIVDFKNVLNLLLYQLVLSPFLDWLCAK